MNNKSFGKKVLGFVQDNTVPLMFIVICAICIPLSGFSASYLINEIVTRMGRNIFLILCLLIPIMAGMGLNFGMTLGAMAGEIALILVSDWQIWGIPGVVLAMILSIPISVLLGYFCGKILNMAKGREMITSYIISYFMNGIYQLIVLYMMGPIIPIKHSSIKLPRGYGVRNTVSLLNMRQCLDNLLAVRVGGRQGAVRLRDRGDAAPSRDGRHRPESPGSRDLIPRVPVPRGGFRLVPEGPRIRPERDGHVAV